MTNVDFSETSSFYSTVPSTCRESILDFHTIPKIFKYPNQDVLNVSEEEEEEEEDITKYYATTIEAVSDPKIESIKSSINSQLLPPKITTVNPPTKSNLQPKINQPFNPYANSLWFNTRGSFGNQAIHDIQERVHQQHIKKRNIDYEESVPPGRNESLEINKKKVDSPISNKHFFVDPSETWVDSASPKYKGITTTSVKYRKAFKELYDTELKYASDLKLIDSVYKVLLKSRKFRNVITSSEELIIFSNVSNISELSFLFLKQIKKLLRFESSKFNPMINLMEVDFGQLIIEYFERIKNTYTSYFQTHEAQIATLTKCRKLNGPKYEKWLDDGAYFCKSQSDCWDLESLLIKPIQRVSKYLLLLKSLIDSIELEAIKEQLIKAKVHLENWLDELNKITPDKNLVYQQHHDSHQIYLNSIKIFKIKYQKLRILRKSVEESLNPMIKFIQYQHHFIETWHNFMDYDEEEEEKSNYIHSIYSSYLEKLSTQEIQTKLLINSIQEKIIKAISLTLEICDSVKNHIKTQSHSKQTYLKYLSTPTKNPSRIVQEYITIQNLLQDELPQLNKLLSSFNHYISLNYIKLIMDWLKLLAGSQQCIKYSQLLKTGELSKGDNFDIIEIFSVVKSRTKDALRDLCVDLNHKDDNERYQYDTQIKISSSKVVRKLFGV